MSVSQTISTEDNPETLLGITETLNININQMSVSADDLLLTCNNELLQHVSPEYLRVTLTRFKDSLPMAMRQITSKAHRSGMHDKPLLVIVTFNQITEKTKSWFKR